MHIRNPRVNRNAIRSRRLSVQFLEDRMVPALSFMGPYTPEEHEIYLSTHADVWTVRSEQPLAGATEVTYFKAADAYYLSLRPEQLQDRLSIAPSFTVADPPSTLEVSLPKPDGTFARFRVWASEMMEPELAAAHPTFQTFWGQGIDDPYSTAVFDFTELGFHAQILSPDGSWYVDPLWHLQTTEYVSFFGDKLTNIHGGGCGCEVCAAAVLGATSGSGSFGLIGPSDGGGNNGGPTPMSSNAGVGRSFRLALAATAEYTAYFGGTVAGASSALLTTVNRANQVFLRDCAIILVLVNDNDSLIYTNASEDPYTPPNLSVLNTQNQANIDSVIGTANYDIGHLVHSQNLGGLCQGRVGNSTNKAKGISTGSPPTIDAYFMGVLLHEMGHQFNAAHTWNSTAGPADQYTPTSAYEPGSGSTIMSYAGGLPSDNLEAQADLYFHIHSMEQIIDFVSTDIQSVGGTVNFANTAPVVFAPSSITIPAQTPFVLEVEAFDLEGLPVTVNFEQRDLGPAQKLTDPDNGSSPLFRSFAPSANQTRYFPQLDRLALGPNMSWGERLPATNRTMHFDAIARDNFIWGGYRSREIEVKVVATGSPFEVTSANTFGINWVVGAQKTITWNVAGTTGNGINASQVRISLSADGGLTFPMSFVDTANDGSETIVVPNLLTERARIKVAGLTASGDETFFDINNQDFSIRVNQAPVATLIPPQPIVTAGLTPNFVAIHYADDVAINMNTIDLADIEIKVPDGTTTLPITQVVADNFTNGSPRTAYYTFGIPGSSWDFADNGTYGVYLRPSEVLDTLGVPAPAQQLGSFAVNLLGSKMEPLAPIVAPSATPNAVKVQYLGQQPFDLTTIDVNDISIVAPDGSTKLPITKAVIDNSSIPMQLDVTYSFAVPSGSWNAGNSGYYVVNLLPNEVGSGGSSFVPETNLGVFRVDIGSAKFIDMAPIVEPGTTPNSVAITYQDFDGIDLTSIDIDDIEILMPDGNTKLAVISTTVDDGTNEQVRTVNYHFAPPGANWDAADNGVYLVNLLPNQVVDAKGGPPIPSGTVGSFLTAIPNAKFVGLVAPIVLGSTSNSIQVAYDSVFGIDVGTFDASDIAIVAPPGVPSPVILKATPDDNTNGSPRVVTYELEAPGGFWDAGDNGTYSLFLKSMQVTDVPGNFVPPSLLGAFGAAFPVGYLVDEASDVVDGDLSPGKRSFREVLAIALNDNLPSEITFSPSAFPIGTVISVTSPLNLGDFFSPQALTIIGPGRERLIFDGGGNTRIFTVDGTPADISLSGLTIRNGFASNGGAISLALSTRLSVSDADLLTNQATIGGGAIDLAQGSRLTLNRVTLTANQVLTPGFAFPEGSGGAIRAASSAEVTLTDCNVLSNESPRNGGGLSSDANGQATIIRTTFAYNKATGAGGGLFASSATITMHNSTFSSNMADIGGGLALHGGTNLVARNSTVAWNSATNVGGGIHGFGGIFIPIPANIDLNSVIVAKNLAPDSPDVHQGNFTANYSLIGNTAGTTVSAPTNLLNLDPLLGTLENNGGLTSTHALLPGSPAINSGNNTLELSTDQRGPGFMRSNGPTDIGAFEVQSAPAKVNSWKINDGSPQRSRVESLTITFDSPVTLPANPVAAFELRRQSDNAVVALSAAQTGNNVALSFIGGPLNAQSLADGLFRLTIFKSLINAGNFDSVGSEIAGDDYIIVGNTTTNKLFRLFGDADGNGSVTATDFNAFRLLYGTSGPSIFDFNNDNLTNAVDFAAFRARFGTMI